MLAKKQRKVPRFKFMKFIVAENIGGTSGKPAFVFLRETQRADYKNTRQTNGENLKNFNICYLFSDILKIAFATRHRNNTNLNKLQKTTKHNHTISSQNLSY